MMVMTSQRKIMGKFTIGGWLAWLGWASTLAMNGCVAGRWVEPKFTARVRHLDRRNQQTRTA
jgi:hypothetical protein